MPEQIIIEGDLVRVVNVEAVSEARLQDLLPHIESRPPITVGLLPKSAVLFYWDESNAKKKRASFLCEVTPGVRVARYGERTYPISLPWTYFLFDFETAGNPLDGHTIWTHTNSRIFWALEQVTSADSLLGTALIPNCNTEGGICYGTTAVDANLPLGVRVDRLVDEFYRTTFTHDSGTGSPWTSETGNMGWERWVAETKKNPQAWREFPEWGKDQKGSSRRGTGRIVMRKLSELLPTTMSRFEPIQLEGTIPDLIEPMTFGRVEEWLESIDEANIVKLEVAIANRRADAAAQAGEAPPPATTSRVRTRTRVTPITTVEER